MPTSARPPFHKRFNIEVSAEEAWQRFLARLLNHVPEFLSRYRHLTWCSTDLPDHLGLSSKEFTSPTYEPITYESIMSRDLISCLEVLDAISIVVDYPARPKESWSAMIERIVSISDMELAILGLRYVEGVFYPSGAELLDERLVNEPLHWLANKGYDSVLQPFKKALVDLIEGTRKPERLKDTVTDMYESLEAMAKIVCSNNKDLSANSELFVSKIHLTPHYKKMLKDYIAYANEFRHAPEKDKSRPQPLPQEVEAFVYTTGLFIRLAIEAPNTKSYTF